MRAYCARAQVPTLFVPVAFRSVPDLYALRVKHCARNGRQNPYHLSRTLSAARAPPCGGLMTEPDRVFACDVIVDDSSRVLCPAAARDRAIEEILELAAPGLERDARRPM